MQFAGPTVCFLLFATVLASQDGVKQTRPRVDDAALRAAELASGEWLTHGRDNAEARFQPARCDPHGLAAASGGVISDLRYSPASVLNRYRQIVLGGEFVSLGMPSFQGTLTETEVESIRAFVLAQRVKLMKAAQGR